MWHRLAIDKENAQRRDCVCRVILFFIYCCSAKESASKLPLTLARLYLIPFAAFLAMPLGYNIHWIVSPTQELSLIGGTNIYGPEHLSLSAFFNSQVHVTSRLNTGYMVEFPFN